MSWEPNNPRVFSVMELTRYIKDLLEEDQQLSGLWVRGEVSNLKLHSSGHIYLTLKDQASSIRCVMFRSSASKLIFKPENGLRVLARGYIGVYERDGLYQFYIQEMQADGTGDLYLAYKQLKEKLEREGLFDAGRKRAIPVLPSKIGIVTSPTGAAIRDIISVASRRFPNIQLILAPAAVQGASAPDEIARAIENLNAFGQVDVIIVGRGGGSLEEIWAFNTEPVARAIYHSKIPVVSAVGHETDFTIADFVADRRAATPSAAAEMVVPSKREMVDYLRTMETRMVAYMSRRVDGQKERLEYLAASRFLTRPETNLNQRSQALDQLEKRVNEAILGLLTQKVSIMKNAVALLDSLSPLSILGRGYAICRREEDSSIITSVNQIEPRELVEVILNSGALVCRVEQAKEVLPWQKKA
ncbi:MAG: exodeoxyribonuclease VII large subunit [Bacillota bacterium]